MLGISGLRGIVGQSLTPDVAVRYAAAFGTWLVRQRGGRAEVVVGRDGRRNGEAVYAAAVNGLRAAGCGVINVRVATTPTVAVVADELAADAGMVVTASHNPAEWNGLKVLLRAAGARGVDACAPAAPVARDIIAAYERYRPADADADRLGGMDKYELRAQTHVREVEEALRSAGLAPLANDRPWFDLRVAVDSVNASGSTVAVPFLESRCAAIHPVACDGSGIFPHAPEPTEENLSGAGGLCDAVRERGADIGFAQDPDADRLAIVDENGRYIGEEYTLVLAAQSLLLARQETADSDGRDKPPVICVNLSTSRMIDDLAARHGVEVVRTPVGEANVVQAMKRLRDEGREVLLGGEGNGGVIWPRATYVRDSLGAMGLVLSLMARTSKRPGELVAELPAYAIVKRKSPLASRDEAAPALERLAAEHAGDAGAAVDTQDGVRIDWSACPHAGGRPAWVHVRPSNTEPILRLIAEAPTREAAERVLDLVAATAAGPSRGALSG